MGARRIISVSTLLFSCLISVTGALAFAEWDHNSGNSECFFSCAKSPSIDHVVPVFISGTSRQGQASWHYRSLDKLCTSMEVELSWSNKANSLLLRLYAPDGEVYGPFSDADDGAIDGSIHLVVSNPDGLPQGMWYFEVYGDKVQGIQSYTI